MSRTKKILLAIGLLLTICFALSIVLALFTPSPYEEPAPQSVALSSGEEEPTTAPATDEPATEESQAAYISQSTYTPQATYTALPAFSPLPTNTKLPTNTPRPTSTRRSTATPTAAATATATALPTATSLPGDIAFVTAVIDGDTIIVEFGGDTWRVRYIGIDTPETGAPCSSEATAANSALVNGETVRMVKDVSETDRYGRLLRYVYVGETFVNGALVAGGWADAVDYPPDTTMAEVLHSLEGEGNDRGCDLMAGALQTVPARVPIAPTAPPPAAPPPPPPTAMPAPLPTAPPPAANCDPSYPTVCIPPPPPDLDCGDIPHRRFTVLPPDPHGFDGNDDDGIGCESG